MWQMKSVERFIMFSLLGMSGNKQQFTFATLHGGDKGKRTGVTWISSTPSLVISSFTLKPNDYFKSSRVLWSPKELRPLSQ